MVKVKKIIRTTFKGQTSSWSEAHAVIAENSKVCRCYFLRLPLLMQLGGNDVPNEVVIFSELTWRLCLTVPEASFSWIHKFSSIPGILASKPLQRSKLGHQLTFNSCFGKRIPVIKRVTKLLAVKNDASEQEETIREKEMKRICVLICLFKKEKKMISMQHLVHQIKAEWDVFSDMAVQTLSLAASQIGICSIKAVNYLGC